MPNAFSTLQQLSRRQLCARLYAIGLSAPLFGTAAEVPNIHFPVEPRKRVAVTSFSFHALFASSGESSNHNNPPLDMRQFPTLIAEHFDIYNIDPLAAHFASTQPAYLDEFRTAVSKANSEVINLCLGSGHFYDTEPEVRRTAISNGKKGIDMAVAIGSPSVRQHIGAAQGLEPNVDLASDSLKELIDYAVHRSVVINLHNDHLIEEDPFFLIKIIQKVNSPYLRALPDFGGSLAGHDAEFNERALGSMFPYALNVCHVKDTVGREKLPPAAVDLPVAFKLARDSGYRGYFSMEFDGPDPFAGTKHLIAETLKYLA